MHPKVSFAEYSMKYKNIRLEREDGILLVTLHTEGDSLVWDMTVHDDLPYLFTEIASDIENKVVILTGAGTAFCERMDFTGVDTTKPEVWDNIFYEGRRLMVNLLDINVPIIAAVNGPARFHSEIPILSDIVLASDTALFQDKHYSNGVVPGDGAHVAWNHVLGPNRGRYYLLTGQELDARAALAAGAVAEVLSPDNLLPRAWELARGLAAKPFLVRRYTREIMTQEYKRLMHAGIGIGLSVEGFARRELSVPR